MIKSFLIASLLIVFARSQLYSLLFDNNSATCLWNMCQEEAKNFSTFHSTQSEQDKQNLDSLNQLCAKMMYQTAIDLCHEQFFYTQYSSNEAFDNFYLCIKFRCYSSSLNTCREYEEGCHYAFGHSNCKSWVNNVENKYSYENAISSCSYASQQTCPNSLGFIAQQLCIKAGNKKCGLEWIQQNKIPSDDYCYPCDYSSSSSPPLVIMLSLLSQFLFFIL